MLTEIETEVCSRCGGSGHHSYCQMYGTICFKCHGAGKVYTKRGQATVQYLRQLRSKRADEFKAGDLVFVEGIPGFSKSRFTTVERVEVETAAEKVAKGNRSMVNGVEVPQVDTLTIVCKDITLSGLLPDSMRRRGCTAEEKQATLKQALEYQDTLTKRGTPRKQ